MTTQMIPLSQLKIDPANARTIGRGADPHYMASIAARGIDIPLIVRPNGKGYLVTEGGIRLESAQALVAQGTIPADYPVPCIVTKMSDAEARETSLTLNVIRTAMHPVDEFRAFSDLHTDKSRPLDVDAIATRFGLPRKHVEQRLALGALDPKVLDAWRDGKMGADAAQAFTLCPDRKMQVRILDKLDGRVNAWHVKHELKIGNENVGRLLNLVGADAYEARKGKVTRDLFGSDHIVSDPKLLTTMAQEKLDATCKELTDAGWAWAALQGDVANAWQYGRIAMKPKPTPEERKRLDALQSLLEADEFDDDAAQNAASDEFDRLQAAALARAFTTKHKAASGCIVGIADDGGLSIEYGRTKPIEKPDPEPAPAKAKQRKGDDHVSNALVQRLSEQLTAATAVAIAGEPTVAMAALLAGFASHDKTVSVSERGLTTKKSGGRRPSAFDDVFSKMLRRPGDLQAALAHVAAAALDFQTLNSDRPPLKDKGVAVLCNALKPTTLNKAIRAQFDAKDYFAAVSRGVIVSAVEEAMGAEHAHKVAKMAKGEASKFAIANVPKTRWLPTQLRTAHYDGPTKKVAPKAKPKKRARKSK